MRVFRRFLIMIGLISSFTEDDVLNAENENDLHDHSQALKAAECASACRNESAAQLRGALKETETRTREFELFEQRLHIARENIRRNA